MRLILLRHGESEANVKRQFAGFTDTPLTERGRAQAEQAALYMGWYDLTRVVSSPLERAYETAWLAAAFDFKRESGETLEIEKWEAFKEMNFGRCEGLTLEAIRQQEPELTEAVRLDYVTAVYPEGESLKVFYERIVLAYEQLIASCENHSGDVLLVAHSGVIRSILAHAIGGGFEAYWRFKVENCGYAVLEYDGDFAMLTELSNAIGKE